MRIILQEDVEHVGNVGDIVTVADGYGRNFLIPRGLALPANERNVKVFAHQQRLTDHRKAKALIAAEEQARRIEAVTVTISKQAGENDRLYGSVTNLDIEDALRAEGVEIDRRRIQLPEPLKNLGVFEVPVKLHAGVVAKVKVFVVKKDEEPAEAEAEAEA